MGSKFMFLLARVWVGLAFVGMGVDIIIQWSSVVEAFVDQLQMIECVATSFHCRLVTWMHSAGGLFVGIGAALALVCGLFILLNYRVRLASFVLLCVLAYQVVFLHPFWILESAERGAAIAFFWGAIANAGALLFCMGFTKKDSDSPKEPPATTHML